MDKQTIIIVAIVAAAVVVGGAVTAGIILNQQDGKTYEVTFHGNGGLTSDNKDTYKESGLNLSDKCNFINPVGKFDSWKTKSDGTGRIYHLGEKIDSNCDLWAIWTYSTIKDNTTYQSEEKRISIQISNDDGKTFVSVNDKKVDFTVSKPILRFNNVESEYVVEAHSVYVVKDIGAGIYNYIYSWNGMAIDKSATVYNSTTHTLDVKLNNDAIYESTLNGLLLGSGTFHVIHGDGGVDSDGHEIYFSASATPLESEEFTKNGIKQNGWLKEDGTPFTTEGFAAKILKAKYPA